MLKVNLNRKYLWVLLVLIGLGTILLGRNLWLDWQARQEGVTHGILTGIPCAPPCWQGFTPDTTAKRGVILRKLRQLPGIGHVWENEESIMWRWNNNLLLNQFSDSWLGYNSIYLDNNNMLRHISLTVDFELTASEIIEKYGIPEATNVVIEGSSECYGSMNLFYPQHGFYFRVKVLPCNQPVLNPSSIVYEAVYPSIDLQIDPSFTQPWPGYGELEIQGP